MTRREQILELTADLRKAFAEKQDELRAVQAEMNEKYIGYARLVRLSEREWDLKAILEMIDRQMNARIEGFIS
jgi:hypothetical protein